MANFTSATLVNDVYPCTGMISRGPFLVKRHTNRVLLRVLGNGGGVPRRSIVGTRFGRWVGMVGGATLY